MQRVGWTVVMVVTVGAGAFLVAQDARFRANSDLVSVYATVTRTDGQYVRNLAADDFRIFDNGQPRDIAAFSNDVQPITVALIVDESGSMVMRLPRVQAAAAAFVEALVPGDRASFSTLTHEGVALTGNKATLTSAIRAAADWRWWDSGSPIYGALDRGMTALAAEGGRRVLVIITDGADTQAAYANRPLSSGRLARPAVFPNTTGADVARRSVREGFMLYALGLTGSPIDARVQAIARDSGGGFDLIGPDENLTTAFTNIVEDLHRQYLLGFVPTSFDGATHTIDVRCVKTGTSVRARASYVADK